MAMEPNWWSFYIQRTDPLGYTYVKQTIAMNTCLYPLNQHTQSDWYLGSATTMRAMFAGAAAFNQPLPETFNTAKVKNVRAHLCWVQLDERRQILIFDSLLNPTYLSSDGCHVRRYSFQSGPFSLQYCQRYRCENIFVLSPTLWESGFLSLTHTNLIFRWVQCSTVQRPSINHYHRLILLQSPWWEYICVESNLMRRQILIIYSCRHIIDVWHVYWRHGLQSTAQFWYCQGWICENILSVQLDEAQNLNTLLPISDGPYVLQCSGFQSTTINIQYCQGWICECMFVTSPAGWQTRFWFLIPTYPNHIQMHLMFSGATAFNQPLPTFGTSHVETVSAYFCWVPNFRNETPGRQPILIFDS